jgi:outer membrane receptor protein involved in Fe transport
VNSPIYPWCPDVIPAGYGPDQVWNYEVGAKYTRFSGRVQLDASLFHMRWQHMQNAMPLGCGAAYTANLGGVASNGFDIGFQALVGSRTRINLAIGYADSYYLDTIVANGAVRVRSGDAVGSLPLVPSPLDATSSISYRLPLDRGYAVTVRAEDVYHGHNPGPFYSQNPASRSYDPGKVSNPATNAFNLRATMQRSNLEVSLALDNATNAQPILLRRNAFTGSTFFYATTLRPRTVSLAIDRNF